MLTYSQSEKHGRAMSIFWRRLVAAGLAWGVLSLAHAAADAGATQDLADIAAVAVAVSEDLALQQGYDNVAVEPQRLDPGLHLPRCGQPLDGFTPQGSRVPGALSVGIACAGPDPWTIYVRTQVRARRAVPVLARPVARHAVITAQDIRLVDQPLESVASGIVFDPAQIVGMELVRPLDEGSTVRLKYLRSPKVVRRGQLVTLVAGQGGLEVRTQGKALVDAVAGERVRVNAETSGKVVEGTARADGTVFVP